MAKGMHRGDLSKARLIDMQQRGVPITAVTQGHEGDFDPYARSSGASGPHANIYPDGYSHSHINRQTGVPGRNDGYYANSVGTNDTSGTNGTMNGYAGNGGGVPFPQPTYTANGRAANAY